MESDLGMPPARHGFLEHWARQGVLLLNSVLTVEMGLAASHRERGWERFTDAAIAASSTPAGARSCSCSGAATPRRRRPSSTASTKGGRHLVLKAPHPSPLSAHNGFFGCRHFSKANAFLESRGLPPIDWALPFR
jgi:uracil-DNA glycosylase